jgi:hypothetical protein
MILTRSEDGTTPPFVRMARRHEMMIAARDKKLEAARENPKVKSINNSPL